ncbi:MAG TPA: VTT domain-containing protein [Chthoniobacterales bacterium]
MRFRYIAFAGAVVLIVVLSRFFPMMELVTAIQQRVIRWGEWGAACYPFLFALCNLLLLPGGILCVGAGFFYGLWWGFFIVLIGNIIAAAISFAVARSIGREWFARKISRYPKLAALVPAVEREGWKIVALSQLHPLFPTSLVTYLYGLSRIPFRTYLLWVTVGRIPGLFLYVYLGTLGQLGVNLAQGKSHPRVMEYWIWGGAFVISALILFVLGRVAVEAMEKFETADHGPQEARAVSHNLL